ncbi:MAG: hypothetical protein DRP22_04125 [Verrucomicrobia bacterium]|nr:MAG: hypothetical protein DRP22_04125 [Verrucomicrobiota bacterium]
MNTDDTPVDILRQLIAIPSINPSFTDPEELKGEHRVAAFVAAALEDLGFGIESLPAESNPCNLVARRGPRAPRFSVTFEVHLDTVGVQDMEIDPFAAEVREGRVWGRGACDDKGPLAALLAALLRAELQHLESAGIEVRVVGAVREESGNEGAEILRNSGFETDWLVVLEPTDLNVIVAHKGAFWFRIEVFGSAAHGSCPDQGLNAIEGMMDVIRELKLRVAAATQQKPGTDLGSPTLNIGTIQGGSALNIVARSCRIEADRRTLPGEEPDDLEKEIHAVLDDLVQRGRIRSWSFHVIKSRPAFLGTPNAPLVRALEDAAEAAGRRIRQQTVPWYSDAGVLSPCSRNAVVFGPGSIADAHTSRESISIDQLSAGTAILGRFIEKLPEASRAASG